MPWERRTVEESRLTFIREYQEGEESKSALCRKYGISRPTGDLWIRRYENGEGISDLSRAPRTHPLKTSEAKEAAILEFRAEHPGTGARKIKIILERRGMEMPSVTTINEILRRNGCISQAASQAAEHYRRFEWKRPNSMWQADFKGNFAIFVLLTTFIFYRLHLSLLHKRLQRKSEIFHCRNQDHTSIIIRYDKQVYVWGMEVSYFLFHPKYPITHFLKDKICFSNILS